jgi:hypothetical protein
MATATRKGAARPADKAKTKGKARGPVGRTWNWGHTNTFVTDTKKWTKDARMSLPYPKTSVMGCVFAAIQHLKKGTDEEILDECLKRNLEDITSQGPRKQVQIKLRRLKRWGVVERAKHTKKEAKHRSATVVEKRTATPGRSTARPTTPKPPTGKPRAAVAPQGGTRPSRVAPKVVSATPGPTGPARKRKPATGQPKAKAGVPKRPKVTPSPSGPAEPGPADTSEPGDDYNPETDGGPEHTTMLPEILEQGTD